MSALRAAEATGPSVVAIGGGHGLAATLSAVRRYASEVTAVVSVADDGGSSGRLRRSTGLPPPGDLRRCLLALAEPDSVWARVFDHRFTDGDLAGHALGNLIIAGLTEATGDFGTALEEAARVLGVRDRVLPVATTPATLRASVNGREVVGEVQVNDATGAITALGVLGPDGLPPRAGAEVVDAVTRADQVIIGPGSLYTSVLAACVVPGVAEALARRRSGRVYVANLAPERKETDNMTLADHVDALAAHGVRVDDVVFDPAAFEAVAGRGACGQVTQRAHLAGSRVVAAHVAGPGGRVHHLDRLASVLNSLVALERPERAVP